MEPNELISPQLREQLPPLGATRHLPDEEKVAVARFRIGRRGESWYAIEFDGEDTLFCLRDQGMRRPRFEEVSLRHLSTVTSYDGLLPMEQDRKFIPRRLENLECWQERDYSQNR